MNKESCNLKEIISINSFQYNIIFNRQQHTYIQQLFCHHAGGPASDHLDR